MRAHALSPSPRHSRGTPRRRGGSSRFQPTARWCSANYPRRRGCYPWRRQSGDRGGARCFSAMRRVAPSGHCSRSSPRGDGFPALADRTNRAGLATRAGPRARPLPRGPTVRDTGANLAGPSCRQKRPRAPAPNTRRQPLHLPPASSSRRRSEHACVAFRHHAASLLFLLARVSLSAQPSSSPRRSRASISISCTE